MEESFNRLLDSKPELDELSQHIITDQWYLLGVQLDCDKALLNELEEMDEDNEFKTRKMLQHWLENSSSTPSRRKFLEALKIKIIRESEVANYYEKYLMHLHDTIRTKSRHLFQKYIKELDHILISPIYIKVSLMLYSKRCINEATLDKIETDHRSPDDKKPLLTAMQEAVHNDYGKLKDIANVLAKFNETRKIADQLKTKYGELTAGDNLRGCKGLASDLSYVSRGKKHLSNDVTGSFFSDGHNTDKKRKLEIDEVTSIKERLIFHEEEAQKLRKLLKEKYSETLTEDSGKVDWSGDMVHLINPSSAQCKEVILELTDGHWNIRLERIQADNTQLLVKAFLQRNTVKWLSISYTPLTPEVIQLVNKHMLTLKRLSLLNDSIGDTEVILLIQSLKYNNTLARLSLYNNPRLTSVSATSLAELIDKNSTLTYLSVACSSLTFDGILQMLKALTTNKTLTKLELDKQHEYACSSTSCFSLVKNTLAFYPE